MCEHVSAHADQWSWSSGMGATLGLLGDSPKGPQASEEVPEPQLPKTALACIPSSPSPPLHNSPFSHLHPDRLGCQQRAPRKASGAEGGNRSSVWEKVLNQAGGFHQNAGLVTSENKHGQSGGAVPSPLRMEQGLWAQH